MSDPLWKKSERAIGKLLGLVRAGAVGKDGPDLVPPSPCSLKDTILAIQVKEREELPDWLVGAVDQAQFDARADQIPMVILHQKDQFYKDDLVIFRLSSILEMRKNEQE